MPHLQFRSLVAALLALSAFGCSHVEHTSGGTTPPGKAADAPQPSGEAPARTVPDGDVLRARDDLPPDQRALMVIDGAERWVDAKAVESAGYTLIDMRDDWTPSIFAEEHAADGTPLHNRYRRVFIGLANDQLDGDGQPLPPGEKNYLELYGVFPSLSVVRSRFVQSEAQPCHDQESVATLEAIETVSYVAPQDVKKTDQRIAQYKRNLENERKKAKVETLEELVVKRPGLQAQLEAVNKRTAERAALAAVERRLSCEQMLPKQARHIAGVYDEPMRLAVRRFQQKHMIYEANFLRRRTVDALARPLLDNDYDTLVRVLRERVVDAAGIIEDGSAETKTSPALNLADDYTKAMLDQLGLADTASALAFFKRHPPEHFQSMRAAIKLPPRPAYYGPNMDLSIVVDRGDVWYDLPFNKDGHFSNRPRDRFPSLTLYVTHNAERIPIARFRTTIGGWRAEQAPDGYEYFRYKGSDVGPRVIRQIISGPVWIAPESTPIRGLVKRKTVNGRSMSIVNYDELGPGYLSAYGVVAGYFVQPGREGRPDRDNGVRAHGSSDYLSIYSVNGYSHGCHRLPNHIAVRLYSFILKHRNRVIAGDQPMSFARQFLNKDDTVYEIKIPSRGFAYILDPPLPVTVLEGTIRGPQKQPIEGYVRKPDVVYPVGAPIPPVSSSPEAKAGGSEVN